MAAASEEQVREERVDSDFEAKVQDLEERLRSLGSAVVALSGGVDSATLLAVAAKVLPGRVLAATGLSPVVSAREREDARRTAEALGVPHVFFESREMEDPGFVANHRDRCYHCKKVLFSQLWELAREKGYAAVAEGSNASDLGDWRPGRRAAQELGVRSPLLEAGLSKEEVRRLARSYGLSVWDKPATACLASRIPYGQEVTAERLARVEAAEAWLADQGFRQVRVRDHGDLARIEVEPSDLKRLVELRAETARHLRQLGWIFVTVDLEGYVTGSLNRTRSESRP